MAAWLWVLPVAAFVYFSVVRPWPVAEEALAADLGDRVDGPFEELLAVCFLVEWNIFALMKMMRSETQLQHQWLPLESAL